MKRLATVALTAVLLAWIALASTSQAQDQPKVIEITAKRFEFAPNSITLKKGEPVVLRLKSEDVTHGFFLRDLKIDELIKPGDPTEVSVTPEKTGTFTVICHHFCGSGHGNMKMTINVVE